MSKKKTRHHVSNAKIAMIKAIFNLSAKDIGDQIGYSHRSVQTWLAKPDASNYRRAPDDAFRKLHAIYSLDVE